MIREAPTLRGNKVVLREKRLEDAKEDYAWKTDPELTRLDAALPLRMTFQDYSGFYAEELRYPGWSRRQFGIDTLEGKHIGNCSYYNLDEFRGEAEVGIMIGDRSYWDKGYGAEAITILIDYLFRETKLQRVYLHTLEGNTRAQKCFTRCGFAPCGHKVRDGHNFVIMEIHRQ